MTSELRVDAIKNVAGEEIADLGDQFVPKYKMPDGTYASTPHFEAYSQIGGYNHSFTTTDSTSFGATSGRQAYLTFNNVHGGNTTGFTTSSTKGASKYKVPVTGIYTLSFRCLVNTQVTSHYDTAFYITDKDDTFSDISGLYPWSAQVTEFTSSSSHGVRGFTRISESDGLSSGPGQSITIKLYKDQHVRPAIVMNATETVSIYLSNHNYFHGVLVAAL